MATKFSGSTGSIIDPNDSIASQSLINLGLNATPDYSDMFIFAELTAIRRASNILTSNGAGKETKLDIENEAIKINLMGFDKETNQYTTRWTNNIGEGRVPYEGFGMTQIKMVTNSSYVPQIDIEFVDIRGLSLVSLGSKSPYAVLWSFPPPIFTLTLKGYYGKALSYNIHLVKSSTKFDATSGNYFINASFIAQKFAPLTDVLFKYIDVVPLMDTGYNLSGGTNNTVTPSHDGAPKNTRDLIIKTKKLYEDLDKFKIDSKEASDLNKLKDEFTNGQIVLQSIANFKSLISTDLQSNFGIYILNQPDTYSDEVGVNVQSNDSELIREIRTLKDYDAVIKSLSPNVRNADITEKLCILYKYDEKTNNQETVLDSKKNQQINDNLRSLKNNLLKQGKNYQNKITDKSIKELINGEIRPFKGKKYTGIDISKFYVDVYQKNIQLDNQYKSNLNIFKEKINDLAQKDLSMLPTIRNIFKIIAQDIEVFFEKLRTTCRDAETEHEKHFDRIVSNNNTRKKTISPFPLIIKNTTINDPDNNGRSIERKERAYPGDESLGLNDLYFPEVEFVENFIETFINIIKEEQIANLKESVDADGNNKWIPVNPLDSVVNGRLKADSPYKGITKIIGGVNEKSVLNELLTRFYIMSQYSYGFLFYTADGAALKDLGEFFGIDIENKNDKLIKFLAEAEATNLINSIVDAKLLDSLKIQCDNWLKTDPNDPNNSGINSFYKELDNSTTQYDDLSDQYLTLNGEKIVKLRTSPDYRGFELLFNPPELRNKSNNSSNEESEGQINFVERYIDEVGNSGFLTNLFFDDHNFDDFTKDNIPYIIDEASTEEYDTDFVYNPILKDGTLLDFMANALSQNDTLIKSLFNDTSISDEVKLFFITKYMSAAVTYYSTNRDVNKKFAFPAVIEIPYFAHLNMGGYMYFYKYAETEESNKAEMIAFNEKYGDKFTGTQLFEENDEYSGYTFNISENDAALLLEEFNKFIVDSGGNSYTTIKDRIIKLIDEVVVLNLYGVENKKKAYLKRLEADDLDLETEGNYTDILNTLMNKIYLLNYTQITFNPTNQSDEDSAVSINQFVPLKNLVTSGMTGYSTRNRQINNNYFLQFFSKVSKLCDEKKEQLYKIERGFRQGIEDNDLKNQTYYSFKAIADKWVVGLDDQFAFGNQRPLIDEFLFVDRFFNDIGDKVMIDIRPIIELSQDYDISVFSVLTKILALNGFEFFPLQNFINFEQDEWVNSFKTYGSSRNVIKSQTPAFVCMYVGGTSSFLNDSLSDFDDDGIANENELLATSDYKTGNVKGFKVNFAKQNQSMFTSIQLDTNEHKETNESLAILSEIAQDQSAASPVPKGQNLYSTFEQRSYTCTVEGLGNAMIQPTQYFILENVPMFNGAYLILDVEHTIVPNNMKTSFRGTRIRTNPNPIVTQFSTATGTKAGENDLISNGIVNQGGVSIGDGTNRNNPNNTGNAGFVSGSAFPVNPSITKDMTGRLISP